MESSTSPEVQSPVKPKDSSINSPPASPVAQSLPVQSPPASPPVQSPPASPVAQSLPVQSPPASPVAQSPPASPPVQSQSPVTVPTASPVRQTEGMTEICKCTVSLENINELFKQIKCESVNRISNQTEKSRKEGKVRKKEMFHETMV